MKKLVFMVMGVILGVWLFGGEVEGWRGWEFVMNVGSFRGIVSLVWWLVSEIVKVMGGMKEKKVGKIGICGLVGIVVCVIGWGLEVRGLLEKYGL